MLRLGICDRVSNIDVIADAGFDYLEIGLGTLARLTEEEFERDMAHVRAAKIKVEACNGMVPADIKLTGPEADEKVIREYLELAFSRAAKIGVRVIVFGSSTARNVPEGFPHEKGWRQIADFLRMSSEYAVKYDLDVVIEPLRRFETNILNLVSEATILASVLQLPRIGVLGDTYHMVACAEPYDAFGYAGDLLGHVHICNAMTRRYPVPGDDGDYEDVFRALKKCGYTGRVSVEARYDSMEKEAAPAYIRLREAMEAVWAE